MGGRGGEPVSGRNSARMLWEGRRQKVSWALHGHDGGIENTGLVPSSYQLSWLRQIPRDVSERAFLVPCGSWVMDMTPGGPCVPPIVERFRGAEKSRTRGRREETAGGKAHHQQQGIWAHSCR